jgi:hypothetical protein
MGQQETPALQKAFSRGGHFVSVPRWPPRGISFIESCQRGVPSPRDERAARVPTAGEFPRIAAFVCGAVSALNLRVSNCRGRIIMNRGTTFILTCMGLLGLAVILPLGDAAAQQKQRVSFKVSAENAKYPQVHYIDVGDVPGRFHSTRTSHYRQLSSPYRERPGHL